MRKLRIDRLDNVLTDDEYREIVKPIQNKI